MQSGGYQYGNAGYGNTGSSYSNQPHPNAHQYQEPPQNAIIIQQWNKHAEWGRKNWWIIAVIILIIVLIANIPQWIRIHNECYEQEGSSESSD